MLNELISVYTQSYLYHTHLSTADPDLYVFVLRYCLLESIRDRLNVISNLHKFSPPPPPQQKDPELAPAPPVFMTSLAERAI